METKEPSSLASHLQDLFRRRQWHTLWLAFTISQRWPEIAGKRIAARSRPAYIQKNILWVYVQDSAWMQQLQAMKPELLAQVQQHFPEAEISDLRWRLQSSPPPAEAAGNEHGRLQKSDPTQAKAFAQLISTIDNKECRDALYRLWLTFHQHREQ